MARRYRRKRSNSRRKFTLPLSIVGGLAGFITQKQSGGSIVDNIASGNFKELPITLARNIGYDPPTGYFSPSGMLKGVMPIFLGVMIHKIASWLGINRALGRARIPIIRI